MTLKNIIPAALLAAMIATPAWASCEWPPVPFTKEQLRNNPGLGTSWTDLTGKQIANCRQAEADKAAEQEREDIHAIRLALEEIAQGLRIRQPK